MDTLNSLELIQAYRTLCQQEQKREQAAQHTKFKQGFEHPVTKRSVPAMEFPPPNPLFVKLKEALKNEIDKRKIQLED